MKARLAHLWDTFHSSFWFVPTNLSLALAVLAALMIRRGGEESVDEANDRQPIQRQFERVQQILEHRLDKDESVKDDGEVQEDKQPLTDKSIDPSPN